LNKLKVDAPDLYKELYKNEYKTDLNDSE
jgi:hypothetical protein